MAQYSQLQEELAFLQEHDEHGDIATGTHSIDDGLSDEIIDMSEDTAAAAEAESEESEVQTESSIHQYLHSVYRDIKKQIDLHCQPNCYQRGDFFYWMKHPVFTLHDVALNGLQPDRLCARDVFIWLPACLPGAPQFFRCTCSGNVHLKKNGEFHFVVL